MARTTVLDCQPLEPREVPAVTAALAGTTLTVTGTADGDRIEVDQEGGTIIVRSRGDEIARFDAAAVQAIAVDAGDGDDIVRIGACVAPPATLDGGNGRDKLGGGGGAATLRGGDGVDLLKGGQAATVFDGGGGADRVLRAAPSDDITPDPLDVLQIDADAATGEVAQPTLTADEVDALLRRASAASASNDAIIAIVDRNGRILGVRVESGVATELTSDPAKLVFAIDGAVSLARTGAFFGSDSAPLTSRTIRNISQSTVSQREVESNPNVADPNSTDRGPGYVAPVGIGGHFPPNVPFTPQVDLFGIEHTNRDGTVHPGADGIRGTADDVRLDQRFNIDPRFVPAGQGLFPPDSYGFESGLLVAGQSRGIATLPGGIPIYKKDENGTAREVGGIGVFFPGKTGFATESNSYLSSTYDPTKPDRSMEAEWIAFAAVGGAANPTPGPGQRFALVGDLGGVALPSALSPLPFGRIDLVGITLELFGPGNPDEGTAQLQQIGQRVGRGSPDDGANQLINPGADGAAGTADDVLLRDGAVVPTGWLVLPHDGQGITAAEVEQIILAGIIQANETRAAIRLPEGSRTRMVFAVTDLTGTVVGLYRMPDATVFSIDVAVAKARNVSYYADASQLQPEDMVPGAPPGTAMTNRTFRYLANPRFPTGIDLTPPGPFSQLNDGGTDPLTGRQVGARLPASAFQSVFGYDSFNPGTNFRQQGNVLNQNGIVFFPGSSPLYKAPAPGSLARLVGGFGVSGDGVDQDDVVTNAGQQGFATPAYVLRADQVLVRGIRLPYQKFNRNPEG